jgi:hypothetical protein
MYAQRNFCASGRISAITFVNDWEFPVGIPHPATEMHAGLHVKCPLLLSDLNQIWNVPTNFSKTFQYKIS